MLKTNGGRAAREGGGKIIPSTVSPSAPGPIKIVPIKTAPVPKFPVPGPIIAVPLKLTPFGSSPDTYTSPTISGTIKPLGSYNNPTSPNTTGLGSQVKADLETLFGSFGSEGVTGGEGTNGKGIFSNIPVFVWLIAAVGLGYFLLKD